MLYSRLKGDCGAEGRSILTASQILSPLFKDTPDLYGLSGISPSKLGEIQAAKPMRLRRMLWSFSRDRGVPGHRLWSSVNRLTGTPINAVWAMVIFAFILGLPMLNSTVAFSAVVSISTIGLYISCERPDFPTTYSSAHKSRQSGTTTCCGQKFHGLLSCISGTCKRSLAPHPELAGLHMLTCSRAVKVRGNLTMADVVSAHLLTC